MTGKIKKHIYISLPLAVISIIIMAVSCTKRVWNPPTIGKVTITNITSTYARLYCDITKDGGYPLLKSGICWSTSPNPTVSNSKKEEGPKTWEVVLELYDLYPGMTYYVRGYAYNEIGLSYSNEYSFTTQYALPTLMTIPASSITSTTALSGGNITSGGGLNITSRGICWNTIQNPTISNNKSINGTIGIGSYSSPVTGLSPGITYYVRAFGINSLGIEYGNNISFTTSSTIPTITTTSISSITSNSAISGGNITSDGGQSVTARGVCWSTSQNPTISNLKTTNGTGTGNFTSSITGLLPGTTYYLRAYATNSVGTQYGNNVSFTTPLDLPTLTTLSVTSVSSNSAISGGNITSDGGSAVTARGVCWSTSQNPTILNSKSVDGNGVGSFTSSITGLILGTTYYVRAYATTSLGTAYGSQHTFTTNNSLSEGLLAWYPFNGNSNDESGNGIHATVIGASLTTDRFGNSNLAYKFSTINDQIYVPNTTITPQNFSLSIWFKVLTPWNYTTLNLFSISPNNNTEEGGFSIRLDQNDASYGTSMYKFNIAINNGQIGPTSARSRSFAFSELNLWKNIVLTKNGSDIRVFLNNSLIISANISVTIDYTNAYLQIGNKRNINNNPLGERILDEIRVYNRILTAQEIDYLSNN